MDANAHDCRHHPGHHKSQTHQPEFVVSVWKFQTFEPAYLRKMQQVQPLDRGVHRRRYCRTIILQKERQCC